MTALFHYEDGQELRENDQIIIRESGEDKVYRVKAVIPPHTQEAQDWQIEDTGGFIVTAGGDHILVFTMTDEDISLFERG